MTVPVSKAVRLHRTGQLDRAETIYRKILAKHPDNADALHFLGVLLHQQGKSDQAVKRIQRALRIRPDYLDARKNLGNILLEIGQADAAERCYRLVITLAPGDSDAWNNLCVALKSQGRFHEAAEAGHRAVALNPGKLAAWFNLGNALKADARMEQCVDAYRQVLKLDPAFVPAHVELCHGLYRMESKLGCSTALLQERVEAYRHWLAHDPDNPVPRFMLAACLGDSAAPRAPDEFVSKLFDEFAGYFDQNLAALDYRVPELLGKRLAGWERSQLVVLDAGCGTGLCGPILRPLAQRLTGVDLSGEMLRKAAGRRVYDELVTAEITAYMGAHPATFDLIASADTLLYFGDLAGVIAAAALALRENGRLLFSLEKVAADCQAGFQLGSSGRYAHAEPYVRATLSAAGLRLVSCTQEVLRRESGEPVHGLLFDAVKAVSARPDEAVEQGQPVF